VTPLLPLVVGLVALAAGSVVLRSFGPRYRVGRLLAVTPQVGIGEARRLADGPPRYVGVRGRIDSEAEFEGEAHQPLVFRRTRLEVRTGHRWQIVDDRREAVAFEVHDGPDAIAIDADALDAGLVVVPREALGTAADVMADRADGRALPPDLPPTAPARLRVEQVSAVEHAVVLGIPRHGPAGAPTLTAGLGRPLVLSTLEPDEAMRILAEGRPSRPLIAAMALAVGLILITVAVAWAAVDTVL
jgi:hypothetical protein